MGQGLAEMPDGCEPLFEPPPRLALRPERRLTVRVAASFAAGNMVHEYRDNAVTLALGPAGTRIVAVGSAVARMFGLQAGLCSSETGDDLAACLRDACDLLRAERRVVPFEAAVTAPVAACVLLRGILLPLDDDGVEAVLSWKQVLDEDATARLRVELMRAMQRHSGSVVTRDAFA